MLAACTAADRIINKLTIFHPDSRRRFPPDKTIKYATTVIPSNTMANDIRNPTERHMEQK